MGKQETISSKEAPRLCQDWQFTLTIWLESPVWWQSAHMLWKASDVEFMCRLNLLVLLHTTSSSLNPNHNSTDKCRLDHSAQNQPWLEARELPKPQVHLYSFDLQSLLAFSDFLTPLMSPENPILIMYFRTQVKQFFLQETLFLSWYFLLSLVLCPGHASMLMLVSRAESGYLLI